MAREFGNVQLMGNTTFNDIATGIGDSGEEVDTTTVISGSSTYTMEISLDKAGYKAALAWAQDNAGTFPGQKGTMMMCTDDGDGSESCSQESHSYGRHYSKVLGHTELSGDIYDSTGASVNIIDFWLNSDGDTLNIKFKNNNVASRTLRAYVSWAVFQ